MSRINGLDPSTAYDGFSARPQDRDLKPLERDILCRILDDIVCTILPLSERVPNEDGHVIITGDKLDRLMFAGGRGGIRLSTGEVNALFEMRDILNPRDD